MMKKNVKCISCGYRKDKYFLCTHCNALVCYQCITHGLCKDCFTLVNCKDWRQSYAYPKKEVYPDEA